MVGPGALSGSSTMRELQGFHSLRVHATKSILSAVRSRIIARSYSARALKIPSNMRRSR